MNDETVRPSINEVLGTTYNLWDPPTLSYLREQFKNKNILIFDAEDTLMYQYDKPDHTRHELFPQAAELLQELKSEGYTLILWSSAPASELRDLIEETLPELFELCIFRDNYQHQPTENTNADPFYAAVLSAPWLSTQTKENLQDVLARRGMQELLKTPQLLFNHACIVEDQPCMKGWVSRDELAWYPEITVSPPYKNSPDRRLPQSQTAYSKDAIIERIHLLSPIDRKNDMWT